MDVGDLIEILKKYPLEAKVFVGPRTDDCVEAQQVNFDISHYLDLDGAIVEDASLCIISEKR